MTLTVATVFRDYETDGVPASGNHAPVKRDVRDTLGAIESIVNSFLASGGLVYLTRAALLADLAHAANTSAWVISDSTVAFVGVYQKSGASGSGTWTKVADIPFTFIPATDSGAGTPNAIIATSSAPVSDGVLVAFVVFDTNTSTPVTVAFNGTTALTIKTASGNNITTGGLTAGAAILGYRSGSTLRLLTDLSSASILAGAQTAQAAAEAAQSAAAASASAASTSATGAASSATSARASAEASGAIHFYDTKAAANTALAGLTNLDVVEVLVDESRNSTRTRYRKEAGVYVYKVTLPPANPNVTLVVGLNDATLDAANVAAAAATLTSGATLRLSGTFKIAGTAAAFSSLDNLTLDLTGAVLRQQTKFSKTFSFTSCHNPKVLRGAFYGYADLRISQGKGVVYKSQGPAALYVAAKEWRTATAYTSGTQKRTGGVLYDCLSSHTSGTFATDLAAGKWSAVAGVNYLTATAAWATTTAYVVGDERVSGGVLYECLISHTSGTFATDLAAAKWMTTGREFDGLSGSYNGVSALFFDTCDVIEVDGTKCYNHAGGDIGLRDTPVQHIHHCELNGIGPTYIYPLDSSSDFAIEAYPVTNNSWVYVYNWHDNVIKNHAFGVQGTFGKSIPFQGNTVGPCPGQHGFYGIENDGWDVTGNKFFDCFQGAVKHQHENYAGTSVYGAAGWVTTTAYAEGAEVRTSSILYECLIAHTSGTFATDLAAGKWRVSPKMQRKAGLISNNVMERCGGGVWFISSAPSFNTDDCIKGLTVTGNTIVDSVQDAMILGRCIDADVGNNLIVGTGRYGINPTDFSGHIHDNTIKNTVGSGIRGYVNSTTWIENNKIIDCGLTGSDSDDKYPVIFTNFDLAIAMPTHDSNPIVYFYGNDIRFTTGDAASAQLTFFGTQYQGAVHNTRTNSALSFRFDGSLLSQWRNDCGFTSGAQAEPTYTITNRITDRSYDANATTVDELADVLGTLLADLKDKKVIG